MTDSIVIVSAARTPMGSFQGDFSSLAAHDLDVAVAKRLSYPASFKVSGNTTQDQGVHFQLSYSY